MPSITNVEVYGVERAIRTAKYPKAAELDSLTADLTKGIQACLSCDTGEGHDNALKGPIVQFDLTMSQNAWMQAERYHWFDIVSSQSKMHKASAFDLKQQCNRYVDSRIIDVCNEKIAEYKRLIELNKKSFDPNRNALIDEAYLAVLYNIPCGFELTAGMTTNYQQLKTIYQQRRHHRLPEWKMICDWIETLPRFMELTQKGDPNGN